MNAAVSPFLQNGDSRLAATDRSGFRQQMGLAGRVQTYASTLEIARRRACSAGRQVIAGDLPPVICQAAMQSPSFAETPSGDLVAVGRWSSFGHSETCRGQLRDGGAYSRADGCAERCFCRCPLRFPEKWHPPLTSFQVGLRAAPSDDLIRAAESGNLAEVEARTPRS